MRALIALLPGDGIGPEVIGAGVQLLRAVAERSHHEFQLETALIGGAAIDATGSPLPDASLALCRRAEAVLLGAVGGPKWAPSAPVRPEQGLLALRKEMGLFANLRPVTVHPRIAPASPVKTELLADVDFVVVRELTGGIYFGEKTRTAESASDLCTYSA
ncbi:MAG: isocitrate/isopropylmalate family dehydrogenase, partial [Myxococcales bacterium]